MEKLSILLKVVTAIVDIVVIATIIKRWTK